ncbi:flagellar basal body-associated protein FliL [Shewanella sp. NFH-SH190041]|uniref:flagellar basal body-associated protein FliL n=1 Tax=Shewanella sp. NFH-SH190041 TaxID=2950245 RepID=UPI0021C39477|nr:flagellar basal body-associated protein FliL [Shewanella sp. NFH-SH190041]BDM63806.1 flagellar basal body-associated protein FliL [Shewanella sp. NFH-SH190041]
MADEPDSGEKPKGKGKLIIIIAAVVVLVLGGAGAFLMMGGDPPPEAEMAEGEMEEAINPDELEEAVYVALPRPFLFNLTGPQRTRLVEIKVQLLVRGSDAQVMTQKHIPLIEDALLTTFSGADVNKLKTQEGKDDLRLKALANVQSTLKQVLGQKTVEKVLFTGFVMQ